ncbi:MAG TPA: VOC family protein, partial [Solirubrobacteraceae bacterium]|nr:VOC family protein [Solirubrobacteraceae bacterium]
PRVRLRQAVMAAAELEPVAGELQNTLGLGEPFRDPGVGTFGLVNTVFAISDCFLEVISPSQPDTAAGRWLERHGRDGGYMVIFDLEDLDGARSRAQAAGVRTVWQLDLPDISGTHLHPADMRGAIVSIDQSRPYGSWRWGGPEWTGKIAAGSPGRLAGATIAVADPEAVATRWGEVLGIAVSDGERPRLVLDGSEVAFTERAGADREGLTEVAFADLPADVAARAPAEVGGVRLRPLQPA